MAASETSTVTSNSEIDAVTPLNFVLIVYNPKRQSTSQYDLKTGTCTLGRSASCSICIPAKTVSATHATLGSAVIIVLHFLTQLDIHTDTIFIRDASSKNGVRISKKRLKSEHWYEFSAQSRVFLGDVVLTLSVHPPDATNRVSATHSNAVSMIQQRNTVSFAEETQVYGAVYSDSDQIDSSARGAADSMRQRSPPQQHPSMEETQVYPTHPQEADDLCTLRYDDEATLRYDVEMDDATIAYDVVPDAQTHSEEDMSDAGSPDVVTDIPFEVDPAQEGSPETVSAPEPNTERKRQEQQPPERYVRHRLMLDT